MPVEWGILAASTATWAVKKVADLGAGAAVKEKIEPAFKKSGLDHELTRAYEAWQERQEDTRSKAGGDRMLLRADTRVFRLKRRGHRAEIRIFFP